MEGFCFPHQDLRRKTMELNVKEKERIIAEEKLRMETRKEFFKENFGGMGWRGRWGGGWHGYGCHGYRCGGFGLFKVLILGLVIFGLCHLWHRAPCGAYPGYYGNPASQAAPAPQPPVKN
jgi:hypothetical protein